MSDVDAFYAELGRRVRRARESARWTQEQLAHRVGLTRSSIANLEVGRQRAPVHVLFVIAMTLEVRVADLLPSDVEAAQRLREQIILPDGLAPSSRAFVQGCLDALG